jgi:DNA-directed RNA polymerase specialized sigma24 family protein
MRTKALSRKPRGRSGGVGAKLTPELKALILKLRTQGITHREIAEQVGVSTTAVQRLCSGGER